MWACDLCVCVCVCGLVCVCWMCVCECTRVRQRSAKWNREETESVKDECVWALGSLGSSVSCVSCVWVFNCFSPQRSSKGHLSVFVLPALCTTKSPHCLNPANEFPPLNLSPNVAWQIKVNSAALLMTQWHPLSSLINGLHHTILRFFY